MEDFFDKVLPRMTKSQQRKMQKELLAEAEISAQKEAERDPLARVSFA